MSKVQAKTTLFAFDKQRLFVPWLVIQPRSPYGYGHGPWGLFPWGSPELNFTIAVHTVFASLYYLLRSPEAVTGSLYTSRQNFLPNVSLQTHQTQEVSQYVSSLLYSAQTTQSSYLATELSQTLHSAVEAVPCTVLYGEAVAPSYSLKFLSGCRCDALAGYGLDPYGTSPYGSVSVPDSL